MELITILNRCCNADLETRSPIRHP